MFADKRDRLFCKRLLLNVYAKTPSFRVAIGFFREGV